MHARAQIRQALLPLITGLPTTGDNVYDSRDFELGASSFPYWAIYTREEEAELVSQQGQLQRTLAVVFSGGVRALDGSSGQATIDTMMEELETALARSTVKSAVPGIKGWALQAIETISDVDDTDRLILAVEMTFACVYFTEDGAPGAFG